MEPEGLFQPCLAAGSTSGLFEHCWAKVSIMMIVFPPYAIGPLAAFEVYRWISLRGTPEMFLGLIDGPDDLSCIEFKVEMGRAIG